MSYDERGLKVMKARDERRKLLSVEERKAEALEQIADSLYAIEEALERIADNG